MNEYSEVEFKYKADNIKLSDFRYFLSPYAEKTLEVSSWDVYFVSETKADSFQRLRLSEKPELTRKQKTNENNNWVRTEVDLPLDRDRLTEELVEKFVGLGGYRRNFKIFKSCIVYWIGYVNYVYYIVYDEELKELGRYIEVEINKEKVKELSLTNNLDSVINEAEGLLSRLGISPQNRMKKSLFELYRK